MYENDYIMRLIHDMICMLAKFIFHKDIDAGEEIVFRDEESGKLYRELEELIYKMKLNQAEELLWSRLDSGNLETLKTALLFYDKLNQPDDEILQQNGMSREDLEERIQLTAEKFGYKEFGEFFFINS